MLDLIPFAHRSYLDARVLQERVIEQRLAGEGGDKVIFCEHPAVVTLGKRTTERDRASILAGSLTHDIEILSVSRGGQATYHGPGQLVIYPVIKLSDYRLGVKRFVTGSLQILCATLAEAGIETRIDLAQTGVYLSSAGDLAKIAFCGLHIIHGVTNHGFALNVKCNLEVFSRFNPCGNPGVSVTDMATCQEQAPESLERLSQKIFQRYVSWLTPKFNGRGYSEPESRVNV